MQCVIIVRAVKYKAYLQRATTGFYEGVNQRYILTTSIFTLFITFKKETMRKELLLSYSIATHKFQTNLSKDTKNNDCVLFAGYG
jgi:hypothetical protein